MLTWPRWVHLLSGDNMLLAVSNSAPERPHLCSTSCFHRICLCSKLKKIFLILSLCGSVPMTAVFLWVPEGGVGCPGVWVADGYRCWELNSSLQKEHSEFLTVDPISSSCSKTGYFIFCLFGKPKNKGLEKALQWAHGQTCNGFLLSSAWHHCTDMDWARCGGTHQQPQHPGGWV